MAMTENTKKVIKYLQGIHGGDPVTSADVAEALGLNKKQVDGIFTAGIAAKGKEYGVRVPAEVELEDGSHKSVKFLQLTEKGLNLNTDEEA